MLEGQLFSVDVAHFPRVEILFFPRAFHSCCGAECSVYFLSEAAGFQLSEASASCILGSFMASRTVTQRRPGDPGLDLHHTSASRIRSRSSSRVFTSSVVAGCISPATFLLSCARRRFPPLPCVLPTLAEAALYGDTGGEVMGIKCK